MTASRVRGAAPSIPGSITHLCDQLADSVFIMDAAGIIRYANAAFERTTGYSRDEVAGRSASILQSGAHLGSVYEEMWKTLQAGEPFRFVFNNRRKDGKCYDEGVIVSPIDLPGCDETYYLHLGRLIKLTRQNLEVFTILANSAPAGIYLQQDGILHFVNERLAELFGRPAHELVGCGWAELVADEDRAAVQRQLDGPSEPDPSLECRIETSDGVRWVMSSVRRIVLNHPAAGASDFTAGYVVDITERKLAEERLRNALSLHAATIESTNDGIIVIDRARRIVSHNRRFAEMWKLAARLLTSSDDVRSAIAAQLKDPATFQEMMRRTRDDPSVEEMCPVDLIDGRHMELYSKPHVVDGEVAGRVWSWRDVTERRRFEAALLRLANYDSLTGLMNRRKFQEDLDACLAEGTRASGALFLLDLDGFKEVNDTFGHQAGDEVLVQVARVLTDSEVGKHIGRLGGDEFAVLLPGVSPAQAMRAAERTLNRLAEHDYVAGGTRISLTGSMGIALYPVHATGSDELLSAADLALYEAKSEHGSNIHVFSSRLRHRSLLQRRGDWQTQLRTAISRGQGKLYAEKTVPLREGAPLIYGLTIRMSGRMSGSRNHVLSSRDLGVLAQQAGLSVALDRWLLREAIALAQRPSFASTTAGLSFELSVHSLSHRDVLRRLLDLSALRAAQGCPLVIELTDFDAVSGAEGAIATLRGAGYRFKVPEASSRVMAQAMSALPIDYLKLDAGVVRRLGEEARLRPLIEGAVHAARGLGAGTIADGAPDAAVLAVLRDAGVDYARGPAVAAARSAGAIFRATAGSRLRAA